ncbi:MAG: type I glyceraldehyde-3-phosphate dehydrogenase [Candidatus Latescibacteria bacterium]|nr:type I glyceraldehyde-3-phosphate dehydrogenase [Candidatus Latescibacterota bacterium]NIO27280.1 type I glyceraldehyde-3-phosphate dehydrogenase [Candidatus Latescibacterota bacterium]NIO54804.1 type I glyceraldehyde-3-phosphate dehydrogenase [Candidatus Latescibacterota bacterium]NIT00887.1 type I glyceraldehyde-3-phosphate dehydrogenase [Candidatus Latescibacterota bacterium]NIT37810.1 type I glyceraldehyde-3-phosphate dehydrogenase [Candidatus Latescibacterota bacterium]
MAIRVAINGFGRIGRLVYRHGFQSKEFDFVAVNDLTSPEILAHLLKYDSVHRAFPAEVSTVRNGLKVDGKIVKVFAEKDPEKLPWKQLGVDVVIESTGHFRKHKDASKHLTAGASKVMISAPSPDADIMIVMGVNHNKYRKNKDHVISTASCTTNCLAPLAKVLNDAFGIRYGLMTTIHAYTNDQRILDFPHKDLRRARAAAVSMIPTTTGAAVAVAKVLPELEGKLDGMAVRVPVSDGSLVDLSVELRKPATVEEVNAAMKKAARGQLKGILQYTEDPIVSFDVVGNPHSSVFDASATMAVGKKHFKVLAWYDNEYGYAGRMVDMLRLLLK